MTMQSRQLILGAVLALAIPVSLAPTGASASCVTGAEACPGVAKPVPGHDYLQVSGKLTKARPNYYFTFSGRAGQTLTIEAVKDPGIKWTGGAPITFPGGKDGDALFPGDPFTLPSTGVYVMELSANLMADRSTGNFIVKLTIK